MVQHRPALGLRHRRAEPGHFYVDDKIGEVVKSTTAYEHPGSRTPASSSDRRRSRQRGRDQDLWARGAAVQIRLRHRHHFPGCAAEGERLSGGGKSSGLMSFLKIGDRAAGAIKSGGTTRRAAKMVIVDVDHPDIEQFIDWKVIEEQKVASPSPARRSTRSTCAPSSRPA
jgi:ribonucleoside-diphosphate reductase alpha chain